VITGVLVSCTHAIIIRGEVISDWYSLVSDGVAFSGQSELRNSWRLLIPLDGSKAIHRDYNGEVDDRNVL